MDVRCERCRAQYVFDDEQVKPAGLPVQCTNCGHVLRVGKKELAVTSPVRQGERERPPSFPATVAPRGEPRPPPPPSAAPSGLGIAHEVHLGLDGENAPRRRSRGARAGAKLVLLLALGGAGAAAYLHDPRSPLRGGRERAGVEAVTAAPPSPGTGPIAAPELVAGPSPHAQPAPAASPVPTAPARAGPKVLLAQADRLRERGDVGAALELYDRLVAYDPGDAEALTGRGLCYLDLERYLPAEASFEAALRIEPQDPDALLGLAETYRFEGKRPEAVRQYERYLAEHPAGEEADVARNAIEELRE